MPFPADETGVHEDHAIGTTWGERGHTPVVQVTGSRKRINVISAISPRGRLWFRCYGGTLNALRYVGFLEALLADVRKRIVLIHDRHPAHVAAMTRRFIRDHKARLTVFELPAYAPDLNPDEHVWTYLKGRFRRDPLAIGEDIRDRVEVTMAEAQAEPARVRSFFEHPEVQYVKRAIHW